MRWKSMAMAAGAGLVLMQLFSGCTALGYGVGYLVDSAGAEVVAYSPARAVAQLETGDFIAVVMKDGTTKRGDFDGIVLLTEEELLDEAEHAVPVGCLENAPLWPGDTITLNFLISDPVVCIYLNADAERLYYRTLHARRVVGVRYWDIKSIEFCDGGILSSDFQAQYLSREFEAVFDLKLRGSQQVDTVASPAIDHIKLSETASKYRQAFAGAGLAVDVTALVILLGGEPVDDDAEE